MVYLAFDLDGTIGNFLPVWKLLCPLRQKEHYANFPSEVIPPISETLKWEIDIAYSAFVKRIAIAETSNEPLGIFRPGIFKVFEEVNRLRKKGLVKGVIMYTNNSSNPLYNFANDVLRYHIGREVFDDILDYRHVLRIKAPHSPLPPTDKRWVELKHLLVESKLKAPANIESKNVMFFDDMHHHDLMRELGAHNNYVKLSEYRFVPENHKITSIFLAALKESEVLSEENLNQFLEYISKCSQGQKATNVGELLHLLTTTPAGKPIGGTSTTGPALDTPTLNSDTMIAALKTLDVPKANNKNNNNARYLLPKKPVTKKKRGGVKSRSVKRVFKYY
jgi:hypothetical protein